MSEQAQNISTPAPVKERKYGVQINPKVYLIVFFIFLAFIVITGILTRVLPQGAYDRQIVDGVEYVVDGTYHILDAKEPLPVWRWFSAPFELLVTKSGATLIAIVLIMMITGGLFTVFDKSGLIQRFLAFTVRRFGKQKYLMLSIIIVAFILFGSMGGVVDCLPLLVPLTVAIALAMKWDSLVGIGMVFVASVRGFAASTLSPYSVGVTQTLAHVPLYSGMWLRLIILGVTIAAVLGWLLIYARRIEKDPQKSLMYAEDAERRESYSYDALMNIPKRKYPFKEVVADFWKGMAAYAPLLPIGAMIMSLSFILSEGAVFDTIVYRMSQIIAGSNPTLAALEMLLTTLVMEIFIAGSFVKAYVLMPIFIPLGDVVGLTRQMVCQVYILGDSFANMLYPTDIMLMMILGVVGCSYTKWLRWCGLFILAMLAFCCAVVVFAVNVGYA